MNTNSLQEHVSSELVPSLIAGGINAALFSVYTGESVLTNIPFLSFNLPAGVVLTASVMGSHLLAGFLENHILNMFQSQNIASMEAGFLKPVLCGLGNYGIVKGAISSGNAPFLIPFGAGAVSSLSGDMIYNKFISGGRLW